MKRIFLGLLSLSTALCAMSTEKTWLQVFDQHGKVLVDAEKEFLFGQYESFARDIAPAIASPEIKVIPIIEHGDALYDVRLMHNDRVTMLPDAPVAVPFYGPQYNSGLKNASKMRATLFKRLEAMVVQLDKLASYFGYQPGQVSIKVFEGLRDLATQKRLFDNKVQELQLADPGLTLEAAELQASKLVSPVKNNVPVHSTGAAVDIRLWDNKRDSFVDMGAVGVIWGPNPGAATFCEAITSAQKINRLYCLLAAYRAGLTNYVYEFWHFSANDRYAAYWREKDADARRATCGSVAE